MAFPRLALISAAVLLLALGACNSDAATSPDVPPDLATRRVGGERQYILAGPAHKLPAALDHAVQLAGGRLIASYPQVGLAIARSRAADFGVKAGRINGVEHAIEDRRVAWVPPARFRPSGEPWPRVGGKAIQDGAGFFDLQWAPQVIDAPAAWAAGHLGQGARVAVLD